MPDPEANSSVRVAAVADLHYDGRGEASLVPIIERAHLEADILLLCGDLTHHGLAQEAEALAKRLGSIRLPMIAVLGNHDFHSDQQDEIKRVLRDSPIHVLDGDTIEVRGVGFAGVKGFSTGFGRRILEPWGESIVKLFVREAVEEALKLESALARLQAKRRVALMHYSPIIETVEGEPLEILPFLGTSRLEEPLNRFYVDAAFHGHAHHGRPEGRTSVGVPVYNVSLPMLRRLDPEGPPFRVIHLDIASDSDIR
jgi:Icc-related predicted phosphoesterase